MDTFELNKKLTAAERAIIEDKKTEPPFSGQYVSFSESGLFCCKRCQAPLYQSSDKFDSGCGWPSFDDALSGAVTSCPDADGKRVEIVCSACGGHLGHVFKGEGLTAKNVRHCVNSLSLTFAPTTDQPLELATFGGGCFWCLEAVFQRVVGVSQVRSGYSGGHVEQPTYPAVCSGETGHAEVVEVQFDPQQVTYAQLLQLFWACHDPTTLNRQGADIGSQYRSVVFFHNAAQQEQAVACLEEIDQSGAWSTSVVTEVTEVSIFYPASADHQRYFERQRAQPYCQMVIEPKLDKVSSLFPHLTKPVS